MRREISYKKYLGIYSSLSSPLFTPILIELPLQPGGSIFITTMNKTQMSKGLAVYAAENLFKVVPPGTHDWEKFIDPDDLQSVLERSKIK